MKFWIAVVFVGLGFVPGLRAQAARVDFNREIRPILSDRCFQCHGFDARARKADLRLDTLAGQRETREGKTPVVPGDPDASELVRRIESDDPDHAMPPKSSALKLSDEERALLRRWVQEGAEFEEHWAFVPCERPHVPRPTNGKVRNEIDAFVLARLEPAGIEPSPTADPATLLRRVTLDLTGLPPTPEELDAFLADPSDEAYERHVDRLLRSRHHGERMALLWLDAARYADTNGFHHDNVRTSWPYRDWVIRAFQNNKPYDEFVVEQLAGDLLPNATEQQHIATAFSRMHNINDEGGALDPEYKVEAVCDRIETISTTFLGLTMTCARCHDHKYDPLTQNDYYSLYAFFNSIEERGVYPNNLEQARAYPARLDYFPDGMKAQVAEARQRVGTAEAALADAQPGFRQEREAHDRAVLEKHHVAWLDRTAMTAVAQSGRTLVRQDDGSWLLDLDKQAGPPSSDVHRFSMTTDRTDLRLVRYEAFVDDRLPGKSVGTVPHGNAVVSKFVLEVAPIASGDAEATSEFVELAWAWADLEQRNGDFDILNTLPGSGFENPSEGWALAGHHDKNRRTAILVAKQPFGFEGGTKLTLHVHYESRYAQHLAGRVRVSFGAADASVTQQIPERHGSWFACGPFPAASFDEAYDRAFGPESVSRIAIDASFVAGKKKQRWRYEDKLQDDTTFSFNNTKSAYYFGREFRNEHPQRIVLHLGSDDAIRVFLDGNDVLSKRVLRGVARDQEHLELEIPRGRHAVVVKIVNDGGPGAFHGRLTYPQDGTIQGRYAPVALVPSADRDDTLTERYAREWASTTSPTFAALDAEVRESKSALEALQAQAVPVLVMRELDKPIPTHVLTRGRYDAADESRPVDRRPPLFLGGKLPADAPNDRLGFARWLVRKDNPLTPRVHVNRLWQMIFGRGIVETSENFGMQASWPSHPELLDWLAARFAQDWDGRALLRSIVTSETYRRSARPTPTARKLDPDNRLLARFPRQRLQGEAIRDLALFASGLLSDEPFGPSVRPYQPEGLWRELSIGGSSNTRIFERDDGDKLYRRSLYTFWKRTSPNPQMSMFDAPTREYCVVRRGVTNTPLQALVLWNDEQFLEAARVLAQRTLGEEHLSDRARIDAMFTRCTGRHVGKAEAHVLEGSLTAFRSRYASSPEDVTALLAIGEAPLPATFQDGTCATHELAAWMMLASTILSLDETIVRD
ncbi:MAG: PSD1 domain-containing protein [Planctomycetes bacterium]|nr:PSD1 domain-containing protein [Planctomycetota bacterium]